MDGCAEGQWGRLLSQPQRHTAHFTLSQPFINQDHRHYASLLERDSVDLLRQTGAVRLGQSVARWHTIHGNVRGAAENRIEADTRGRHGQGH